MNTSTDHRFSALVAGRVARLAGKLIRHQFDGASHIDFKGATDLVTETDLASEALIRDELARQFPGDLFRGEEGGGAAIDSERVWIADPLDGTTNFAHRIPHFSVSIACCERGEPVAGAVYQPINDDLFYGWKGGGAWRNGKRIHVSTQTDPIQALAVTGFPYDPAGCLDALMARVRSVIPKTQGLRRFGSAAMDLCYTAAGLFDLYWETTLKPWDVAAGFLLVREAGGRITDFHGRPAPIDGGEMLATNGLLHDQMLNLIEMK
ncbi:MAG TPA: inositol monophosphatase family protein [Candidatus Ozemobacteraceae bacterium]|nr:inositol monophosphatase family protein [Candidatus Ozemobacteraceae bacterium]